MDYRLYALDSQGHFTSVEEFSAETDAAASKHAEVAALEGPRELWAGGRRIGSFGLKSAAPNREPTFGNPFRAHFAQRLR